MKNTLTIVAVLLILAGIIWILQGVNILPGSFMTGQIQWVYNGAVSVALGGALLFAARRRKSK